VADKGKNPEQFWREYEASTGEKVLFYTLGKYLSGCDEFNGGPIDGLWGLLIATVGGFRFHHFPHEGWIQALSRIATGGDAPSEKTIFIPAARIISADVHIEKKLWKRILMPSQPLLKLRYRDQNNEEKELLAETDRAAPALAEALRGLIPSTDQCTSEDSV
jgi:hypothetical protein